VPQPRDLSAEQTFEEAAARDPVGLARTLVRALRASHSRRTAFEQSLKDGNEKGYFKLKVLELLRDVPTRWDSTYQMIKRIYYLRAVSDVLSLLLLTDLNLPGSRTLPSPRRQQASQDLFAHVERVGDIRKCGVNFRGSYFFLKR
jgi:hypothetical protein